MKKYILLILIFISIAVATFVFSLYSFRSLALLKSLSSDLDEIKIAIASSDSRFDDVESNFRTIEERIGGLEIEQSDFDASFDSYRNSTSNSLSYLRNRTVSRNQFESILRNSISELELQSAGNSEIQNAGVTELDAQRSRDSALKVLEANPNHIFALKTLGNIAFEEGDLPAAESFYKKVLSIDPGDEESLLVLSRITLRNGLYAESAGYFEHLLSIDRSPIALVGLGRCRFMIGNYISAYDNAAEALSFRQDYIPGLELKKDAAIALGRTDEAEEALLEIIGIDNSFENYISLGDLYRDTRREEEALDVYEEAYEINPLDSLSQQNNQIALLRTMMDVAYNLENDSKMGMYFQNAELFGGDDEVHVIRIRRLRDQNQVRKVLKIHRIL